MTVIGKFKELYNDNSLPSIRESFNVYTAEEKEKVLKYLKKGKKGAVAPGKMIDVLSGKSISGDFCCYSDGKYAWRSDTVYYFEKYNIALPDDFIKFALEAE